LLADWTSQYATAYLTPQFCVALNPYHLSCSYLLIV
jgi:hypothetical protein